MSYQPTSTATLRASGDLVTGPCTVRNLGLTAGADAATVVFRDGGALGPILWTLGAGIGLSAFPFKGCMRVKKSLYAVITGTTPYVHATIENPASSQLTVE